MAFPGGYRQSATEAGGLELKDLRRRADGEIMVDSPRFLFQHPDLDHVRAIVNVGYYYKDGVEYERLFVSAGEPDPNQPGVDQWMVRGYPTKAA